MSSCSPLLPASSDPSTPLAPSSRLGWLLSGAITAAALLAAAWPVQAAQATSQAGALPQAGRWVLTVEVERDATSRQGADHARRRSRSLLEVATTLQASGPLQSHNAMDPAEHQRHLAQAAQVQQRVQQVQLQQQQLQQQPGRAAAFTAHAGPTPAEMMARVQQMQATCGADQDCLAREAMRISAAHSGLDAQGQGRLQAYGAAYRQCEARHPEGPQRRTCIDTARRNAGGQPDATDHDDDPAARFLLFVGGLDGADCRAQVRVQMTDRTEGASSDVQGMVPYVIAREADGRPASPLLCSGQQLVMDVERRELWSHGNLGLGAGPVRGRSVKSSGGRLERSEETMELDWFEAAPWITEQLRRLPLQGERRHVVPLQGNSNGTQFSGEVRVRMQWRFEPA